MKFKLETPTTPDSVVEVSYKVECTLPGSGVSILSRKLKTQWPVAEIGQREIEVNFSVIEPELTVKHNSTLEQ